MSAFDRASTIVASATGKPAAFLTAAAVVVVWAVSGPFFGFSETWQLVINTGTTIITFLMVFVLQAAQNRDGAAIQAKLDELIRAVEDADDSLIGIDKRDCAEVEAVRGGR